VNFAVKRGPVPNIHIASTEADMQSALIRELRRILDPKRQNVEPSDVLVMAPGREDVCALTSACDKAGILWHTPVSKDRDQPLFQQGRVTVSTIKSAKGFTAPVCHVAYVHNLADRRDLEAQQQARAELHVACTRATIFLDLWGTPCDLMSEADLAAQDLRSRS